jgi:hypothetical protein
MTVGYARFAAVSLGMLLASTVAMVAARILKPNPLSGLELCTPAQVELQTRLAKEGAVRDEAVRAELTRLGKHAWAGTYLTKGEDPVQLVIAPEAGFTLYSHSWCNLCEHFVALGKIRSVESDRLELQLELAQPDETARFELDETLHLVRWGELLFAVPAGRLELFCAEASDGSSFPYAPFRTLGAPVDSEDPLRPPGKPDVPREFEHLLLDAPITATITALAELRPRPALDGKELHAYDALFTVDAGTDDGLAVGMYLFIPGARHLDRFNGRVEAVEQDAARFQLLVYDDRREWARGLVGERVSTKAPEPKAR